MIKIPCQQCGGETKILHSLYGGFEMGSPVYCCAKCKLANRLYDFEPLRFVKEDWETYERYFPETRLTPCVIRE